MGRKLKTFRLVKGQHPPACPHCQHGLACRWGSFRRREDSVKIPRFRCRQCLKTFSAVTSAADYRQKKRHLNGKLYHLLVSGVSMRRAAWLTRVNDKTVARRLVYFGKIADLHQSRMLKSLSAVEHVHFDDMESSIHTKLKPVSMPLAVSHPTRLILSFDVVSMPAKGHLAEISRKKYGPRADHRRLGWKTVLEDLRPVIAGSAVITTDSHSDYPGMIQKHLINPLPAPGPSLSIKHIRTKSRRACVVGQGELKRGGHDPLFSLNHTAAMLRANVNRLFRRTWCTSKRIDRLRLHMAMYRTWHNELILAKLEHRTPRLAFGELRGRHRARKRGASPPRTHPPPMECHQQRRGAVIKGSDDRLGRWHF